MGRGTSKVGGGSGGSGGSSGGSSSGGGNNSKPTKARDIENMNEAQLDKEIKDAKSNISRAEKIMSKNDITDTADAKAMQNAFPLGVGGDGWSAERRKARNKGIERDAVKAKAYTEAYTQKKASETRLKNLEDAKKQVAGTGKTLKQIRKEKQAQAVKNTTKTLTWKTTQKGGWVNGAYRPKVISAGEFEIHGSDGLYSIFKNGTLLGRTDKLSKAKAYVENKKKK